MYNLIGITEYVTDHLNVEYEERIVAQFTTLLKLKLYLDKYPINKEAKFIKDIYPKESLLNGCISHKWGKAKDIPLDPL